MYSLSQKFYNLAFLDLYHQQLHNKNLVIIMYLLSFDK